MTDATYTTKFMTTLEGTTVTNRSHEGQEERKGSTGVHEEKIMGLSEYKPARSELQYKDNPLSKPATALQRKFKVG